VYETSHSRRVYRLWSRPSFAAAGGDVLCLRATPAGRHDETDRLINRKRLVDDATRRRGQFPHVVHPVRAMRAQIKWHDIRTLTTVLLLTEYAMFIFPHYCVAQGYDTIRDAILTCNQKLTRVSLIYCTEPTTKKWKKREKN